MKKFVLLAFCVLSLIFEAHAQELTVRSMRAAAMDLSARIEARKDVNEVVCALVKIQLLAPGAVFEGNVVGDCEYRINEYWVYLTHGTKMLRVKHPNYLTLDIKFSDYLIDKVESRTTYSMVIALPAGYPPVPTPTPNPDPVPDPNPVPDPVPDPVPTPVVFDSIPEPVPMNMPPKRMKIEVFKAINTANKLANENKFEEAISNYAALAHYFPSFAQLHYNIAKTYDSKYKQNPDDKLSLNGAIHEYERYVDLESDEKKSTFAESKKRLAELRKIKGQ